VWAGARALGDRRCGIAAGATSDGTPLVAAVLVDAVAELSSVPVRVRRAQWVPVDARLLVPASAASVVVLEPSGPPRTLLSTFHDGKLRSGFTPDRPGAYSVQVLADVGAGPRPVLEARIYVDTEPPESAPYPTAPGEQAAAGEAGGDDAAVLARMIAAVRRDEGVLPLTRDARLDALARTHAERMRARGTVAHDIGDGDPVARLEEAGLSARLVGENAAHAASVVLAHRALYGSPSHRANLLKGEFDRVGVGVVAGEDGSVWAVEMFARGLR